MSKVVITLASIVLVLCSCRFVCCGTMAYSKNMDIEVGGETYQLSIGAVGEQAVAYETTSSEQGYQGPNFAEIVVIAVLAIGSACGAAGVIITIVLIILQLKYNKNQKKQLNQASQIEEEKSVEEQS